MFCFFLLSLTDESCFLQKECALTGEERALSGNSPVISEPVLVNPHKNGAAPANGKTENVNVPTAKRSGRATESNHCWVRDIRSWATGRRPSCSEGTGSL
jgi:hypothetical protein